MDEKSRSKGLRFRVILTVALFLCTGYFALCRANVGQEVFVQSPGGSHLVPETVTVEGKARVRQGENGPHARVRAVEDAQRNALIEAVRPLIHPVVLSREKETVLRILIPKKGSILTETEITGEQQPEPDLYTVFMKTKLARDRAEDILIRGLPLAKRVIIITSDRWDGKPSDSRTLDRHLASLAIKKGYGRVDPGALTDGHSGGVLPALHSGDAEAVDRFLVYFLVSAVVEGRVGAVFSEETRQIYSSRAEGTIRVYKARGGAGSFAVRDVLGFGSNEKKSGTDAIGKASAILASKTMKSLSGGQKKK